jgi:hypothetical protein
VYYVFSSKRIMTINKALLMSLVSWTFAMLIAALPFYVNSFFIVRDIIIRDIITRDIIIRDY